MKKILGFRNMQEKLEKKRLSVIRLQKYELIFYCPSKASDPSTKCQTFSAKFKDIRYKNWKTTDPGHIFWHSLLWKKENGIRRKVFGLFAALYHLEEWLNCHWKSVKVIFRVGGHFLYLLMAEQNNFWVLGFQAFQTNEYVWFTEVTVKSRVLVRLI